MTVEDKQVWKDYTRGVQPVRKEKKTPDRRENRTEGQAVQTIAEKPGPFPLPLFHKGKERLSAPPLERKREKALRQGTIAIEARLDLHGMTQAEAFAALSDFMRQETKAGKRHLLIITGKGRGEGGVLRRNLETWLSQLPESRSILALRPAAPHHGGGGAFYVVMRKK
ncbi:MAG: Smr/MutS family protein [Alphaproteobacteria bacterium]|nr:Smr/MutS family protein [Alphaproteobacteria bacterium]